MARTPEEVVSISYLKIALWIVAIAVVIALVAFAFTTCGVSAEVTGV